MLEFFRNFFHSRWGVGVTLGLLGVIALAFAAGDVASSGGFGGVAGGDRAAMVGKARIGTATLAKQVSDGYAEARQQNPHMSIKDFLAAGGLEQVLSQLLDSTAITEFGRVHGIIAGKRLVDSELAKIPALQGPDGRFSDVNYRQLLAQRQLTDTEVRDDIRQSLVAKQILQPAGYGAAVSGELVIRYAALLKDQRDGTIAVLPAAAFAPKTPPSPAELAAYYAANRAYFIRPERRVLRYVTFDASALKSVTAPSEAEIAARYNTDHAQYAASQSRSITQLIVTDEGAAREILAEVAKGGSLNAAAAKRGLAAASLGSLTRDALAGQSSSEAAAAAFAARKGAIAGPVKTALGYTLFKVDSIDDKPARSLAQVHGAIAATLAVEKRRAALADATARIADEFDKGGALTDAAKELGLALTETSPITANGQVYGKAGQAPPKELTKVVQTAFSMERENEPQLAELAAGKTFVMFDVSQIAPSAPAPLDEIRADVTARMMLDKGAASARTAALKVLSQVRSGQDIHAALAGLGVKLPPAQALSISHDRIPTLNGKVPPEIQLFFKMAQGTVKLLPAPGNAGWYLVQLKSIKPGVVNPKDPLLANATGELSQITGQEYAEEMRNAIRAEVGIRRNEVAIRAVASQLGGN